jgi:sialidase-1
MKKYTFLFLAASAALASGLDTQDLFIGGQGGYRNYRIPGLVVTAKGTVLAYAEARRGSQTDWGVIDIMLRRSTDRGKTWSEPKIIANVEGPKPKNPVALAQNLAQPDEVTYNNPVAIVDRGGPVHFVFCLEYMHAFYMRSDDDGVTFTKPVEITATFDEFRKDYAWKVLATGPAHGIQTKSGRLIVPVWLSDGTGGHAHRPSVASVIYSDDRGKTWKRGEIAVPNSEEYVNPSETIVAQLSDGRVMLNVRSESKAHRRLVTYSKDGATKWTKPAFHDELLEPICMASIVAARESGKPVLIFANPHNLERAAGGAEPGRSRDRRNLVIKMSRDDGKTWPVSRVLDPGVAAYSDLAVLPDGTILCLYERSGEKGISTRTAFLTLAKFTVDWLKQ